MSSYLYSHRLFITLCTCSDPESRAKMPELQSEKKHCNCDTNIFWMFKLFLLWVLDWNSLPMVKVWFQGLSSFQTQNFTYENPPFTHPNPTTTTPATPGHAAKTGLMLWKAIWVFIQHFPISGIISRYREFEFPISGNQFPISGNNQFPDIGKWFSDIGNWFSDIGKCVWFPDIGKSIPDIQKSPPYRSRSLRHPATPPYHAPYQQWPPAIPASSETVITTSVNHSVYTYIYAKLDQCNQK